MTVSLIFTRNHSPGSALLRAALWSPWSHVALLTGHGGLVTVIEAAAFHGVRERPIDDLAAESSEWHVARLPCREPERVIAAARSQLGKPYDWAGVFGLGFRRRWQDDDAWFCSELIAWAFGAAGAPLFNAQHWRITPRDLSILELPRWAPVPSRVC